MSTPLVTGATYDVYLEDRCDVALRSIGPGGAPCLRLVYEATLGSFLVFRRPPELDRDGVAEGSRLMVPLHRGGGGGGGGGRDSRSAGGATRADRARGEPPERS